MFCPRCHSDQNKVLDSRQNELGVKRRRQCLKCAYRFTTLEELLALDLDVEKRAGTIQAFSIDKLEEGIRKAFNKRRISDSKIKLLIQKIIENILETEKNPIKSTKIGQIVLKSLKAQDEAAYICYCAMFGNFEIREDFLKLLREFEGTGKVNFRK